MTALLPASRAPGAIDVFLDEAWAARLTAEAASSLGLTVGDDLDERAAMAVSAAANERRAYERAIAALAIRGRATGELRRLLARKGHDAPTIARVIDRLAQAALLDDAQFARNLARAKGVNGGMSRRRVAAELARRGVDRPVAEAAIAECFEEEGYDEAGAAERVAERKLRAFAGLAPDVARRRLYGFLARRGYSPGIAMDIARRLTPGK